jgi:phage head maturation protease
VNFEPEDLNPLAEKLFKKVLHGTIRSASVGFLPLENPIGRWGKGKEARDGESPTFYYCRRQLLEFSLVNIPSNPDAIKRFAMEQLCEFMSENDAAVIMKMQLDLAQLGIFLPKNKQDSDRMQIDLDLMKL